MRKVGVIMMNVGDILSNVGGGGGGGTQNQKLKILSTTKYLMIYHS